MSNTYNTEAVLSKLPPAIATMEDCANKQIQATIDVAREAAKQVGAKSVMDAVESMATALEAFRESILSMLGEESDVMSDATINAYLSYFKKLDTVMNGGN